MAGGLALSFESDLAPFRASLSDWARNRFPSIARNAINDTVVDAREAEQAKIRGVFDRPRPVTVRAPLYRRATKEDLTAAIYINDEGARQERWLLPQVRGGGRRHKPFEQRLIRAGLMEPFEFAVPAIGQKRDAYGNLSGPLLERILSQLGAAAGVGYLANATARSRRRNARRVRERYFVPDERHQGRLPRGVYERQGDRIRAVLVFVSAPHYRPRYDFGQAMFAKAARVFPDYFARRFYAELGKAGAVTGGGSLGLVGGSRVLLGPRAPGG